MSKIGSAHDQEKAQSQITDHIHITYLKSVSLEVLKLSLKQISNGLWRWWRGLHKRKIYDSTPFRGIQCELDSASEWKNSNKTKKNLLSLETPNGAQSVA